MGNSIEEEIEILEELRTHGYAMLLMKYENRIKTNRKIDQALEHIVSDYKRVLKEKNRLEEQVEYDKTHIYTPQTIELNFISKSKIEDKIEKLNSESYAEKLEDMMNTKNYTITELVQYVLQELLDGSDTDVGSIGNSIEEDMKYIHKTLNDMKIKDEDAFMSAVATIFRDYKRVLKDNERYKKSDYETICLENNELREITDRIQSEYNDLLKDNFKLKNELETKRKEYQETYKDVREELKELRKENEGLNNRCRNLDKEAQAYLEELAGDNTLTRRTIKQLQEENEELKNDYENLSNSVVVKNYYIENSIPVQKVKDNIKKLEIKKEKVRGERNILERFAIEKSINSLQELLESED